jgi:hypothetical protein
MLSLLYPGRLVLLVVLARESAAQKVERVVMRNVVRIAQLRVDVTVVIVVAPAIAYETPATVA